VTGGADTTGTEVLVHRVGAAFDAVPADLTLEPP
jgi:hypothetical protein